MNKELTKAEEQVMQALWKIEKGFANEIVAAVESDAAYNTVLTVVRVLEQKGFVERRKGNAGKLHFYSPLITRERYRRLVMDDVKQTFFGGSFTSLVSFFAKEEKLTDDELSEILRIIEKKNS